MGTKNYWLFYVNRRPILEIIDQHAQIVFETDLFGHRKKDDESNKYRDAAIALQSDKINVHTQSKKGYAPL